MAASIPAGPPPATNTFFFTGAGVTANSFSRPVRGFITHFTGSCAITLLTHPCMQPVQWMMSSNLPSLALLGNSGSAREARPMATPSAFPLATIDSATKGSLIRPTVNTGMLTTFLTSAA